MKTIVYKCPGFHSRPGGTYDFKGVDSETIEDALNEGWFKTLPEAIEGKHIIEGVFEETKDEIPSIEVSELKGDEAPPSREELEQKAKELGVKFDGRTSDRKLLELINDELE